MAFKVTQREDLPDYLSFGRYRSRPREVRAVQLEAAEQVENAFAGAEGFAGNPGDWKVVYGTRPDGVEDSAIVAKNIFEQTYEQVGADRYRKRAVLIEAAQLAEPLDIVTLEGPSHGEPGHWLLLGLEGEPYFNDAAYFRDRYQRVDED